MMLLAHLRDHLTADRQSHRAINAFSADSNNDMLKYKIKYKKEKTLKVKQQQKKQRKANKSSLLMI